MKPLLQQMLCLGVKNQSSTFLSGQIRVFNSFNLLGLSAGILRSSYLAFISPVHYSPLTLAINTLPVFLSIAMMLLMLPGWQKLTSVISFVLFPPAFWLMYLTTGDVPAACFILLYFVFPFFFLQKRWQVMLAFGYTASFFILMQAHMIPFRPENIFTTTTDPGLQYVSLSLLLVFAFMCLFTISQMLQKYQQSLRNKKTELAELVEFRNKIFSIVSHDLRTPLAATSQLIDLLEYARVDQEEFDSYIVELKSNLDSTRHMMDNMLFWAKAQLTQSSIKKEHILLQSLVGNTMKLASTQARNKGICLIDNSQAGVRVEADPDIVQIILTNLVNNALKFTAPGGSIHIETTNENGSSIVSVTDSGVGIPLEKQELIFSNESFTTQGTQKEGGSGLGLKLCRDLAKKTGAHLSFESAPGYGTTFRLIFPPVEIQSVGFERSREQVREMIAVTA